MADDSVVSHPPSPDSGAQIQQGLQGDRNQAIAQMFDGTAIANVEILNQITQQLPLKLEVARYSLPADAAEFTGREAEIGLIEADLQAGWVVVIAGMAGVGKSALAVRVAHRLKERFPGGQIYLNLRGADSQPVTVEAAVESLLRALGVDPVQIPTDPAEKAALYRSRVAQQPTLVVLDNAANARQVKDLLPGIGACLLTSRRQVDGMAGMKFVNLEALSPAEAFALFQKVLPPARVQAEADAAKQIVDYCGRLPLALRIAAATLGMRSWQGRRLADYAHQLADERQRLDHLKMADLDIRASFELSYRELTVDGAHLLGWLALLPGDFGTAILQPLIQQPDDTLQTALAELVDGRLVDPVIGLGERYSLHDLMRLFALEKLKTQAQLGAVPAAKERLVMWCGAQADIWNDALNPRQRRQLAEAMATAAASEGFESATLTDWEARLPQAAVQWFEVERRTLVSAVAWASEIQQWSLSVLLAANLAPFFQLRGYWIDWMTIQQQALTAAQQTDDQWIEGLALSNLGDVHGFHRKWNEAIACYEKALHIFRAIGDVQGEGKTLGNLGTVYDFQRRRNEAIAYYEQSLHIFRAIGDVQGEGKNLTNMGVVYQSQGKRQQAIICYEKALHIFRAIGDVQGEGTILTNAGIVYKSQGKWQEAVACHLQSVQIFRAIGDAQSEGKSLNNLGNMYHFQGKRNEAIACYEKALHIFRAIGDVQGEGTTLMNLGLSGGVVQSLQYWQSAIEKLHPDSPEYRRIYALLHPNRDIIIAGLGIWSGVIALVFACWQGAGGWR
jgi:tetratricopeptide (TPR) repeat protein